MLRAIIQESAAEWSPERFQRWGAQIGPETEGLVIAILARHPHSEQGFRTCMGILQIYKGLTRTRAESSRPMRSQSAR